MTTITIFGGFILINRNDYNKEELEKWVSFRNSLSSLFPNRTSAVMNLIDSLSSNYSAKTAVQLSENDLFHYNYNSLYKAINNSFSFSSWQKKSIY